MYSSMMYDKVNIFSSIKFISSQTGYVYNRKHLLENQMYSSLGRILISPIATLNGLIHIARSNKFPVTFPLTLSGMRISRRYHGMTKTGPHMCFTVTITKETEGKYMNMRNINRVMFEWSCIARASQQMNIIFEIFKASFDITVYTEA